VSLALMRWRATATTCYKMSMLKLIHVSSVVISGSFFLLRFVWMLRGSDSPQQRWLKIFPHIIDTILLASGIALVVQLAQYPFVDNWLTAKLFALFAYILLGSLALKRAHRYGIRVLSGGLALFVFAYIVGVAVTRMPLFWLTWN